LPLSRKARGATIPIPLARASGFDSARGDWILLLYLSI
jgi:hypothetical protein